MFCKVKAWACIIKSYTGIIMTYLKKLDTVSHFYLCLLIADKVCALRDSTLKPGTSLAWKHWTKVEETASDKHSSLLRCDDNYSCQRFIVQVTGIGSAEYLMNSWVVFVGDWARLITLNGRLYGHIHKTLSL